MVVFGVMWCIGVLWRSVVELWNFVVFYGGSVDMTGLLHEGSFHVQGLTKSVTFGSLHKAYITCNWAEILICYRH